MEDKKAPTEGVFKTKDYWLIIYLICKYTILNVEKLEDSKGQPYLLWSFPCEAKAEQEPFNRGVPMTVDIHKAKEAAELFKRNLHYFEIRA